MVGGAVEPRYDDTPRLPAGFDPRKWVFDSRTNEFHKITSRHGAAGNLIDARTYDQRRLAYLLKAQEVRKNWIAVAVGWAVTVACLIWMAGSSNPGEHVVKGLLATLFGLSAAGGTLKGLYDSAIALPLVNANVGPPPPARPGREAVERQKVHGEGGTLGGDRLREAARGGSLSNEGAAPLETYDD